MGTFSRLAKDTAVYGISSIVARTVNFFFVPLYTRILSTSEYGSYSEIISYIALLQVALTFGLETGFFRFANHADRNPSQVYATAIRFLFVTSVLFFAIICYFSGDIAAAMDYGKPAILYAAGILAIDCFTAVLFAKLRYERKAWTFATFRSIKIFSEVAFNVLFLLLLPVYFKHHPNSFLLKFVPATPDYSYVLFAVFCSCLVSLILFIPELLRIPKGFSKHTLKELMLYSLPLMIAGLPGVANDFIARILFRFFAPDTSPWRDQVGIFNANTKLAVIMLLFVQMFRYAAEPFFFATSNQSNIKQVYAAILKYFTAFCMIIFVGVMVYIDVIGLILGKDFRSGIVIVPIMLMANVLLGINQNLSMWYKLSGKTNLAIIITISGLGITLLINMIFMPLYGYYAAAWGYLISYVVMVFISYRMSCKYYPVPYQWGRVGLFILSGVLVYLASLLFADMHIVIKLTLNTLLLCLYVAFILKIEKIDVRAIAKRIRSKF